MKVIFLDIDGVICLQRQWGSRKNNKGKKQKRVADLFDKKAIKALNRIVSETNAKIVLSSTWRGSFSIQEMQDLFDSRGVIAEIIDYTPIYEKEPEKHNLDSMFRAVVNDKPMYFVEFWAELRTMEINDWLKTHPEVSRWVAVDDMPLMCKNFVQTPLPTEGIKQSGIPEKIISTLKD